MGTYISQADLEAELSAAVVLDVHDDNNNGVPDAAALDRVIEDAESLFNAGVGSLYVIPLTPATPLDPFVKMVCLRAAAALTKKRHPEYVRSSGADEDLKWVMSTLKSIRDGELVIQHDTIADTDATTTTGVPEAWSDDPRGFD